MSDQSLIQDFADETREHLEELESSLLRLESDPENQELLNNIFRSMHTIKGASEYLGFERIALLSHRLENLLDQFRDGSLIADKVAIDLLIDARDRMGDLIAQIGTSGQETADIEDLLERITAAGSSSAASGSGSAPATAVEGEADEELFTIFVEQLAEGIDQLIEIGGHLARNEDVAESTAKMTDTLDRLSATANYMGYDNLVEIYVAMQEDLETFASQLENVGDVEIDSFLQSTMADGLQRIQELFPNAQPLKEIDAERLRCEAMAEDSDSKDNSGTAHDGEPSMTGDEAVIASTVAATHSPDVADLLADLPPIDDNEREFLLSKTLDETFSSMHHVSEERHDRDHTDPDADPIAMQFSTEMHVADDAGRGPRQGQNAPDTSSTILDDFGTEQEAAPLAEADPAVPGEPPQMDPAVIDTGDLWPEAPEITPPAPEIAATSTDAPLPRIDLSAPDTEQEKPVEAEADEEAFSARNTIRKSIRVDAEKVDDLMNQVGELVVNRSSFTQLFHDMRELGHHLSQRFPMQKNDLRMVSDLTTRLSDAATVLGRVSGELQEQVMKVRMLPISRLFNRYPRLVHDLLRDSDKKIQLQFRGEETELDRMVIEQLADPMIHIIRNAVDHGIESQEDRLRKGKSENGTLMLEAYHEGSNVIIEVTDDGQGIDLSRIRQKAIEKQLADRETLEQMDQKALIDMIMLPGFSTTDEVTHTSGRGVGMDVVKRNIEKINGTLEIDTRQDVGTRIQIKLPLTLAIIQALMVSCGDSHLTIPMSAVQETLRIDQGEIFTVDGNEVMHLHEEPLPLVRLSELLSIKIPKASTVNQRMFVVVIKTATGRIGFIVDTLLGRQEVVIKPLEDYLQEKSGFSGATILGDGAISLILDVDELVVMAKERQIERKLAESLL